MRWPSKLVILVAALAAVPVFAEETATPPTASEAPVAMLVDITSGQVLHSRNSDRRFVPASITKVMTIFHAFELMDEGILSPSQTFIMPRQVWEQWSGEGSTMWIEADADVAVVDLLAGIANVSANDGSVLLAQGHAGSVDAWVNGMNARARDLELASSHFGTPNGWPDEGRTFTSAQDLVVLAEALLDRHPDKYARIIGKRSFTYNGVEQFNYDPLIGRIEGADGIKTGFTNEAGYGYLGTAERDGQRLVMVVAGAPTLGTRARAARRYIEWGFAAFDRQRLFGASQTVGEARVQGGDARSVPLRTDRDVFVNVPKNRASELQLSIVYDGPVRAPFEEGEEIASLVVEVPGMEPARMPLLATQSVDEAGVLDRIVNALAGWLG